MPSFGPWELLIIFLIFFILFGARRVADLGGAMGKSIRDFRSAFREDEAAPGADERHADR